MAFTLDIPQKEEIKKLVEEETALEPATTLMISDVSKQKGAEIVQADIEDLESRRELTKAIEEFGADVVKASSGKNDLLKTRIGDLSRAWMTRTLNLFRGQSLQGIAPHYALWNGSPESGGSELSGENYRRVAITFGAPAEQASGQVLARNSAPASFPRPTTAWGTWTHTAIYTAASSGEPIWIKARAEPKEIKRGYMPRIAEGSVSVGLN